MDTDKFESWAIVEVMGHSRYAGKVTEQAIGGTSFVRVDVPATEGVPAFTKLLGSGSIFAITPCSEDVAKEAARRFRSTPCHLIDFVLDTQKRLPLGPATGPMDIGYDDELDDDSEQDDAII